MPLPPAPYVRTADAASARVLVTHDVVRQHWSRTRHLLRARARASQWSEGEGWRALDDTVAGQRLGFRAVLSRWQFPNGIAVRPGFALAVHVLRSESTVLGTWIVACEVDTADGETVEVMRTALATTEQVWTRYALTTDGVDLERVRAVRVYVEQTGATGGGTDEMRVPLESISLIYEGPGVGVGVVPWVGAYSRSQAGPPDDAHSHRVWLDAQRILDAYPRLLAAHARPTVSGGVNYAPAVDAVVIAHYAIPANTLGHALRIRVAAANSTAADFTIRVWATTSAGFVYSGSGTPTATLTVTATQNVVSYRDLTITPAADQVRLVISVTPSSGSAATLAAVTLEWVDEGWALDSTVADMDAAHSPQKIVPVLESRVRPRLPIVASDVQGTGTPHAVASDRWTDRFATENNALAVWRLATGPAVVDWLLAMSALPVSGRFRWGPWTRDVVPTLTLWADVGASGTRLEITPDWSAPVLVEASPGLRAYVVPLPPIDGYDLGDDVDLSVTVAVVSKATGAVVSATLLRVTGLRLDEPVSVPASDEVYAWGYDAVGGAADVAVTIAVTRAFPVGYLRVWVDVAGGKATATLTLSDGTTIVEIAAAGTLTTFTTGWISDMSGDTLAASNPMAAFRGAPANATWTLTPLNCGVTSWGIEVF